MKRARVTPPVGCTVALTSLSVDAHASSSGPATFDVATSADAFAVYQGPFPATGTTSASLGGASVAGAVEVRIYGFGATSPGGTFRLQNALKLSGTLR